MAESQLTKEEHEEMFADKSSLIWKAYKRGKLAECLHDAPHMEAVILGIGKRLPKDYTSEQKDNLASDAIDEALTELAKTGHKHMDERARVHFGHRICDRVLKRKLRQPKIEIRLSTPVENKSGGNRITAEGKKANLVVAGDSIPSVEAIQAGWGIDPTENLLEEIFGAVLGSKKEKMVKALGTLPRFDYDFARRYANSECDRGAANRTRFQRIKETCVSAFRELQTEKRQRYGGYGR